MYPALREFRSATCLQGRNGVAFRLAKAEAATSIYCDRHRQTILLFLLSQLVGLIASTEVRAVAKLTHQKENASDDQQRDNELPPCLLWVKQRSERPHAANSKD